MRGATRAIGCGGLVLLMLAGLASAPPPAGGVTAGDQAAGVRIVAQDAVSMTLELRVPPAALRATAVQGHRCYEVTALGLSPLVRSGQPPVPARGELLAVPSQDLEMEVEPSQAQVLSAYPLCPNSAYVCSDGDPSIPCTPEAVEEGLSLNGPYPGRLAEVGPVSTVRGQTVVRVQFYPIQVDPARGRLLFYPVVRVQLAWDPASQSSRAPRTAGGPFDEVLRQVLLNPAAIGRVDGEVEVTPPGTAQTLATADGELKVYVEQDGIAQITKADLEEAGWDPEQIDPRTLKLSLLGEEQAVWVEGEEDGHLDPGDALVFYGQASLSPTSRRTVYWLAAGGAPGLRMTVRDVSPIHGYFLASTFPATLHAEGFANPAGYWQNPPGRESQDHWYWTGRLPAPSSAELPFQMPPFDASEEAALRLLLAGATDDPVNPDHHTRLLLNGTMVDEAMWDGQVEFLHSVSLPRWVLGTGENILTLETLDDTGAVVNRLYGNWLEVDYPALYRSEGDRLAFGPPDTGSYRFEVTGFGSADLEAFDISSPTAPVRLTGLLSQPDGDSFTAILEDTTAAGSRALIQTRAQRGAPAALEADLASNLHDPANGADEIVIAYDEFYTDTLPLAAYRQAHGLRVQVVRMSDVYDEFSGGMVTPQAIRDFLAYAYASWVPPAPSYALLVGDAHLDWLDRFATAAPILVPTAIFDATQVGETANETWLACVDGADPLPDLFLGRLSARSRADVQAMVDKILQYEAPSPPEPWTQRALFVADDDDPLFETISEGWIGQLPPDYQPARVFAADYPPGDPQADIVETINAGVFLTSYMGHGYTDRWGSWSGGWLFDTATVAQLANGDRQPFVVTATCLNGFFVSPFPGDEFCLAEELARREGGGAIGVWSPTALGYPAEHQVLFARLLDALFAPGDATLGGVTTAAKLAAYSQGISTELIETFALFGDPALRIPRAAPYRYALPFVGRGAGGP